MNYLLDTNIIIILFEGRNNEIRDNVKQILLDDENNFYVSTISLLEIAQLYRKKKFKNINDAAAAKAIGKCHALSKFNKFKTCVEKITASAAIIAGK
mgnify:CR=1 FL=1